jgi:hypothetical protein
MIEVTFSFIFSPPFEIFYHKKGEKERSLLLKILFQNLSGKGGNFVSGSFLGAIVGDFGIISTL